MDTLRNLRYSPLAILAIASPGAAQEPHVRLIHDEQNREFVVVLGPVDLPSGMHHGHEADAMVVFPVQNVELPISAYLHGFSYDAVDRAGRTVPNDVVHHINLINPDYRELFLPISQRLLAVGRETGSQSMPGWLLGVPVTEGTNLAVAAMLHNPTGESYSGVEVRVRLRYVKTGRPWPFFKVYPFHFDVQFPVGDTRVDLPPGRSEFSYEASPAMEGRIMGVGSHLHEYAVSIRFEDVTAGRLLWEGFPKKDQDGSLTGVTIGRFYRRLGLKIYPDHTYRVTVYYDNPTADTLSGEGMGVVAGAFIPSGGVAWPRADLNDPIYILDRRHYLGEFPTFDHVH